MEITSRKLLSTEFHGHCINCKSTFIFNILKDMERLPYSNDDAKIKCPVCGYNNYFSIICDFHKDK